METVYGNTQGIKAVHVKQLQRLYEERQPNDRFVTAEFAQKLTASSSEIHHPICCFINRRGQIVRLAIGTPAQNQLDAVDLPRRSADRFSGIRCVAVLPAAPTTAMLAAMVGQRLDALVVLVSAPERGAIVKETHLAHLVPDIDRPWTVISMPIAELSDRDFGEVDEWEKEFQVARFGNIQFHAAASEQDRVLLVGVQTDDVTPQRFEDGLAELAGLVETAGGEVVGTLRQKRSRPHPQTVVGQGKAEEIALQAQTLGANLVIFDRNISPTQSRNLEDQIGLSVVDRTQLILDIFAQRAQSQAGKLQVELAQLGYTLPRLRGRGQDMSRLGGGIGTRGPGETRLEIERRTIQKRIGQLQQEVNQLQAHRSRQRQQRQQRDIPTIAIIGYTNAGKSTLLNVLTQAEVYVANQLFATLDPTTRRLTILSRNPGGIADATTRHELLLTDTVGFIHDLPPALMDAFRATLEEVSEADIMLHLVDLSHPAWASHIQSVESILAELPSPLGRSLLVFNKVDRASNEARSVAEQAYPDAVLISATRQLGFEQLRQRLLQLAEADIVNALPLEG